MSCKEANIMCENNELWRELRLFCTIQSTLSNLHTVIERYRNDPNDISQKAYMTCMEAWNTLLDSRSHLLDIILSRDQFNIGETNSELTRLLLARTTCNLEE